MMYRILMDGHDIYGSDPETAVISPHLDIELNSAGSLEFTLPVDNMDWDSPQVFTNEVEVIEDGEVIFFGRPLQITRDWNNQKKVVCEGALSYFNDTIQRTHEIKMSSHTTLEAFFRRLIDVHNSQVDDQIGSSYSSKHFEVGTVDIENKEKYVYRKTDYQTTLECLQQMCLDTDGGYFILRKEYDAQGNATRYIDWLGEMPYGADQPVQFGLNLLNLSIDLNGADICTVLIPLGGENINLSNFSAKDPYDPNNIYQGVGHIKTSDEIYYQPGIDLYGRVVQQKTWNDYTSQNGLWMKAAEWLKKKNEYIPTIEVDAADLHYIDEYQDQGEPMYSIFKLGMAVQVISPPHGFTENHIDGEETPTLIIHKLSLDLDSATKKVTIGTPPKRELTDILAPSSSGGSTRNSGGEGERVVEGHQNIRYIGDVMVKASGESEYSSTRQNGTVYLDMDAIAGGTVKDVQVDGVSVVDEEGIAEIQSAVSDVLVDGSSVVNEDHEAEISIPVKGVTYNGVDVVNPNTGIAEIDQSMSIGNIEEYSWYERSGGDIDQEVRTVTITDPGVYVAILSTLAQTDNISTYPELLGSYYMDLTVSGGRILDVQTIDEHKYGSYYGPDTVRFGKVIIFLNESTSTVTFKGTNYHFYQMSHIQVGVDTPVAFGWYEYDSDLNRFVPSSDALAVQDKYYFIQMGYGDFNLLYDVQVGVDTPAASGWYEYNQSLTRMEPSKDEYAIQYKNYYEVSAPSSKCVSSKIRNVFKLSNIDTDYITCLGYEMYTIRDRIFFSNLVPDDKNVYLIIAQSCCSSLYGVDSYGDSRISDVNGNKYYTPVQNYQGIDLDDIFYTNTIENGKSIIHIGDGTYRENQIYDSRGTILYNEHNIKLTKKTGDDEFWVAKENVSYVLIDTGKNIHANTHNPCIDGSSIFSIVYRISQPPGVLDVLVDGTSVVDSNMIANIDTTALDVITANPKQSAVDFVNKLKINGLVYDISVGEDAYKLATPYMTSNTTPSGVVSASSNAGGSYQPWYAFSGTLGDDGQTWVTGSGQAIGGWIQYQFDSPVVIKKLATTNRNEANNRVVKKFKFQASNDGTNFTDLATCTVTSNASHYRQEFEIDNYTLYEYYRLYVLETWVSNDPYAGFAQVEMYNRTPGSGVSHNYSLEEQKVGKWYDDSDIYERVLHIGTPSYNSYTAFAHGISNFSKLIDIRGTCVKGGSGGYKLATPYMTSNTTPYGVVSASSYYNDSYAPWYAFCGTPGNDQQTWASAGGHTVGEWIQYKFVSAVTIKKLATTNRNEGNPRVVRKFTFQASNDGTNYTDLAYCEITSNAGHYRQEFTIQNTTAYLYYRLYVTEPWVLNDFTVGFAQVEMYEPDANLNTIVPLVSLTANESIFLGDVDGTNIHYQFGSSYNLISDFDVTIQYTKRSIT